MFSDFHRLTAVMNDWNQLVKEYNQILNDWFAEPLWSLSNIHARRIFWKDAAAARLHYRHWLDQMGLYIFGSREIPRYIGMTKATLWRRLNGRYLSGEKSQCALAEQYGDSLIRHGRDGFPPKLLTWYRRNYHGYSRLDGAVDFAAFGINTIWFALIPADTESIIHDLELRLIDAANEWNIRKGHLKLLNAVEG